jgi:hypothetical protein
MLPTVYSICISLWATHFRHCYPFPTHRLPKEIAGMEKGLLSSIVLYHFRKLLEPGVSLREMSTLMPASSTIRRHLQSECAQKLIKAQSNLRPRSCLPCPCNLESIPPPTALGSSVSSWYFRSFLCPHQPALQHPGPGSPVLGSKP